MKSDFEAPRPLMSKGSSKSTWEIKKKRMPASEHIRLLKEALRAPYSPFQLMVKRFH